MKENESLTTRQENFCIQYVLNNGNAAKAARDAGYSEDSDQQQGYENLTKPFIVKRITELRKELGQEDFGVEAEWIIARLKSLVERCMQLEKAKANLVMANGDSIQEEGIFQFNATGAAKALDQLAKIKQMYSEKAPRSTDEPPSDKLDRIKKRMEELESEE